MSVHRLVDYLPVWSPTLVTHHMQSYCRIRFTCAIPRMDSADGISPSFLFGLLIASERDRGMRIASDVRQCLHHDTC